MAPAPRGSTAVRPQRIMTIPNVITLGRLFLTFAVFYYLVQQQLRPALVLFVVAWGLDVIDGLIARRWQQSTDFGYLFDKAVDRLLLIGTGVLLFAAGYVSPIALIIFAKDILLLPLLLWQFTNHQPITDLGIGGKLLTLLQGAVLLWLMLGGPAPLVMAIVVGVIGIVVSGQHLYRTLT